MADLSDIAAVTCDIFGTTVDWRTGVGEQSTNLLQTLGVELDGAALADEWRERYLPSMRAVNAGDQWRYLDELHRDSLDELLAEHGVADQVDEIAREVLVRTWHRLPAWPDSVAGVGAIAEFCVVAALSNGGMALLTNLVKSARLPFDVILSAELARRYKPDTAPYWTAARLLDLPPERVLMVAAHHWDIEGARNAGLTTAFLERPQEKGANHRADRAADSNADLVVDDFHDLAARLAKR